MSRRNNNADAAVTAVVLFGFKLLWMYGLIILSGIFLVPYVIETWAAWFGHAITIEWWKGLLIGLVAGIITGRGIVWFGVMAALVTWLVALCGFTGA
ncbi:hypothetical protein D3C73_1397270 [compost metagenome]